VDVGLGGGVWGPPRVPPGGGEFFVSADRAGSRFQCALWENKR